MDRGAWRATVHGVAKSWTRLSDSHTCGKEDLGMEEGGRSDKEMQKQPTSFCSSTFQGAARRKLMLRLFQAPF